MFPYMNVVFDIGIQMLPSLRLDVFLFLYGGWVSVVIFRWIQYVHANLLLLIVKAILFPLHHGVCGSDARLRLFLILLVRYYFDSFMLVWWDNHWPGILFLPGHRAWAVENSDVDLWNALIGPVGHRVESKLFRRCWPSRVVPIQLLNLAIARTSRESGSLPIGLSLLLDVVP